MRKQNNIIYKEIVLFLSNSNGYNNIEKDRNVGLLPFPIRGFHYNIPPKYSINPFYWNRYTYSIGLMNTKSYSHKRGTIIHYY